MGLGCGYWVGLGGLGLGSGWVMVRVGLNFSAIGGVGDKFFTKAVLYQ